MWLEETGDLSSLAVGRIRGQCTAHGSRHESVTSCHFAGKSGSFKVWQGTRIGNIATMVNTLNAPSRNLTTMAGLLRFYVVVAVATIVVLGILSAAAPHQAPTEAWVHAVIVAVFAVLLPIRMRSALRGSVGALRAVGIISAVLFLVNVVEALIPNFVPIWMRVEMICIALLMAAIIGLVIRERV